MTTKTPTINLSVKRWNLTAFVPMTIDDITDRKLYQFSVFTHILIQLILVSFMVSQSLLVFCVLFAGKVYCPKCRSQSYIKRGKFWRNQDIQLLKMTIKWSIQRLKCKNCNKSFNRFTNTKLAYCKNHPIIIAANLISSLLAFNFRNIFPTFTFVNISDYRLLKKNMMVNDQKHPSDAFMTTSMYFMDCLDEKQRRLYSGLLVLLYGTISEVHAVTFRARKTIRRGFIELQNQAPTNSINEPIRLPGAGRPRLGGNPQYYATLEELLEEETSGDPMKDLKYRYTSLRLL